MADLRVDARLPGELSIEVVERVPAAVVVSGSQRIPVSAGGLLLRGVAPAAGLPVLSVAAIPAGPRLTERRARAAVAILSGAPEELSGGSPRSHSGSKGLELEMRNGPEPDLRLRYPGPGRSGRPPRACSPTRAHRAPSTSISGCRSRPQREASDPVEPDATQTPSMGDPGNPLPQP